MKTACFIFATIALTASAHADPSLIVPGHGIGRTELGPNGKFFLKRLPRPVASDVGMSQQRLVWVAKTKRDGTQTLYIHTVANGALNVKPLSGVTIDDIRVTSPFFHTWNGIRTGSSLSAIRRHFPGLRRDHNQSDVYDASGIAFEFADPVTPQSRCIAIDVHPYRAEGMINQGQVQSLLREGRS